MNRQERRLWDKGKHPLQAELRRKTPLRAGQTSLKRTGLQRSQRPIKKQSTERGKANSKRARVLDRLRQTRGGCELHASENCTNEMHDGHEIHTRGRGGSITDDENILMTCRTCHTLITDNPAESDCYGFTVQEWRANSEGFADAARRRELFHSGVLPECADWCKADSHRTSDRGIVS